MFDCIVATGFLAACTAFLDTSIVDVFSMHMGSKRNAEVALDKAEVDWANETFVPIQSLRGSTLLLGEGLHG